MKDSIANEFCIGNIKLPIKVVVEHRTSYRFSIARKSAILRLPNFFSIKQREAKHSEFLLWIRSQYDKNPSIFSRFEVKSYKSGDKLTLMGIDYIIDIQYLDTESQRVSARMIQSSKTITLLIPIATENSQEHIAKLIKMVVAKSMKPIVEQRLNYLAKNVVGVEYKALRIKDSISNWGSCSGKKNINISLRTLLLPPQVADYVLVHELCHLKELNHSPAFWNLVSKAMPNYKMAESWITKNGSSYSY